MFGSRILFLIQISLTLFLGIQPLSVSASTSGPSFPVTIIGGDERSFAPEAHSSAITLIPKKYDVVVIGGGLAGLAGAVYVSDREKSVFLIEKEAALGGLAQGGKFPGSDTVYDRGAAYFSRAYPEEREILNHIGLNRYEDENPIPEPSDSYLWNGHLYLGIWEEETLEELPASFALFKRELELADAEGLIPNQPFELAEKMELDRIDAVTWIREMPARLAARTDEESREIHERFERELATGKLDRKDPMDGVIGLMDLYCRSALGSIAKDISAMAFANFYISEIDTRFTTPIGTGVAAESMVRMLKGRKSRVRLESRAAVTRVSNHSNRVEVTYSKDGKAFRVIANYVIFAAQLRLAPAVIDGFEEKAPAQVALMKSLEYSNYAVHAVEVKGHPYRATYDTWTRPRLAAADDFFDDFSDVILGRWMEKGLSGYHGFRDFKKDPPGNSIMTIYHHLHPKLVGTGFGEAQAKALATRAAHRMAEIFNPVLKEKWGTQIEVVSVASSRWPFSIHVAGPEFFIEKAAKLREPFGRVLFANNNLGSPSFEEALFRGHCAANNILIKLVPEFTQEVWTKCPLENLR